MLGIVDMYRKRYHESERAYKHEIIEEVLSHIRSNGGRFLERVDDFENSFWNEVPHSIAYRKVGHAFRSNARKQLGDKFNPHQQQHGVHQQQVPMSGLSMTHTGLTMGPPQLFGGFPGAMPMGMPFPRIHMSGGFNPYGVMSSGGLSVGAMNMNINYIGGSPGLQGAGGGTVPPHSSNYNNMMQQGDFNQAQRSSLIQEQTLHHGGSPNANTAAEDTLDASDPDSPKFQVGSHHRHQGDLSRAPEQ
jgi:hypothetical protein